VSWAIIVVCVFGRFATTVGSEERVAARLIGCDVCTNVTVFSSLLPSDSTLNVCGRAETMRAVRVRIAAVSGSGVDVMTSLVGDAAVADTVASFCDKSLA
jgi:hypothetical protein